MSENCHQVNAPSVISGKRAINLTAFLLMAVLASLHSLPSASAQIQLQIGGSEADFKAALTKRGYDRIDTHKLGLSNSSFNACKDGIRWRIKFEWTGRTSRKEIGKCREFMAKKEIRKLLRDRGYRRITIEDRSGKYIAVGCQADQRFRAEINYYGDIRRERPIGQCRDELSPADVTAKLEQQGYDRIRFIDRQLPKYVAEVCKDQVKLELTLDRFGEIRDIEDIGRCRASVAPEQIVDLLKERGFTRIKLVDDQLPRYVATGCLRGQRVEVTMNKWGEILNQINLRPCRESFNRDQIAASMRDNGYTNISVKRIAKRFIAKGCRDNTYEEIIISRFGELISHRELGNCNSPKFSELAETLRGRGMRDLTFFVEGCRDGSKVKIVFDEFANRISRDVVGSCSNR